VVAISDQICLLVTTLLLYIFIIELNTYINTKIYEKYKFVNKNKQMAFEYFFLRQTERSKKKKIKPINPS